jgi:uncharacterized protein YndB with AHSA1/START domain
MNNNQQTGDVDITNDRATLKFTRFLAHPPKAVWEAITDPAEFNVWYNAEATIDARQGGTFAVLSGPFHWSGAIRTWEPPKVFEYEHNHEPVGDMMPKGEKTVVRWELSPSGEGTKLQFSQSNLTSVAGFAPGTHVVLDRLTARLDGKTLPDFNDRYNEVESLYPVWSAGDAK